MPSPAASVATQTWASALEVAPALACARAGSCRRGSSQVDSPTSSRCCDEVVERVPVLGEDQQLAAAVLAARRTRRAPGSARSAVELRLLAGGLRSRAAWATRRSSASTSSRSSLDRSATIALVDQELAALPRPGRPRPARRRRASTAGGAARSGLALRPCGRASSSASSVLEPLVATLERARDRRRGSRRAGAGTRCGSSATLDVVGPSLTRRQELVDVVRDRLVERVLGAVSVNGCGAAWRVGEEPLARRSRAGPPSCRRRNQGLSGELQDLLARQRCR